MGLETATYVTDLVTSNPPSSDLRAQGDDHLRLIKSVLQSTFPNGSRAYYLERTSAKSANYSIVAADDNAIFYVDTTAGNIQLTLPAVPATFVHWRVVKISSDANQVTFSGTVNGTTLGALTSRWQQVDIYGDGSSFSSPAPIRAGGFVAGDLASDSVITAKILDAAVTLAKMANLATQTAIGRNTASTGVPEAVTITQMLNWLSGSARGDVIVRGASDWDNVAKGSAGQVLRSDGTDTAFGVYAPLLHLREEQTSGTASQTTPVTANTWNKRLLNQTKTNEIASASVASSVISLPAGTYEVDGSALAILSANGGTQHAKVRLRDTTNGTTLVAGMNEYTSTVATGGTGETHSCALRGRFTLAGTANIEVQLWNGGAPTGASTGEVEIYTDVMIRRVT